ncbi:MAG TPA: TMEM175 family protein [Chthonomonadaceae bacterium]|nr:TMEM175 family protein [Chthonomonadaceae bacterium]
MGIREPLVKKGAGADKGFRWRGKEVSRVEGFSDAVFGFALTLLVVSLQVPKTFTELLETLRGFLAFGICFALLLMVWERHYTFFRRYGLQDGLTVTLNGLLHLHAWRQRDALELNASERMITRVAILRNLLMAGIGLLSAGLARVLPLHLVGIAGYLYMLICVVETLHGHLEGEASRKKEDTSNETA